MNGFAKGMEAKTTLTISIGTLFLESQKFYFLAGIPPLFCNQSYHNSFQLFSQGRKSNMPHRCLANRFFLFFLFNLFFFFFFNICMFLQTLSNTFRYLQESWIPPVVKFIESVLILITEHLSNDIEELYNVLTHIFNPLQMFYLCHGHVKPLLDFSSDCDPVTSQWLSTLTPGAELDLLNTTTNTWSLARVIEISPTETEIHIEPVGNKDGTTEWISTESNRIAMPNTKSNPDASISNEQSASQVEDPEVVRKAEEAQKKMIEAQKVAETAWRRKLCVGMMVDAKDTADTWYQVPFKFNFALNRICSQFFLFFYFFYRLHCCKTVLRMMAIVMNFLFIMKDGVQHMMNGSPVTQTGLLDSIAKAMEREGKCLHDQHPLLRMLSMMMMIQKTCFLYSVVCFVHFFFF